MSVEWSNGISTGGTGTTEKRNGIRLNMRKNATHLNCDVLHISDHVGNAFL